MFERFRRDRRGGVAIAFGLALVPVIAMAGAAVDYGRVINGRTDVQQLIDNAALIAVSGETSEAREKLAADFIAARKGDLPSDLVLEVVPKDIVDEDGGPPRIRLTAEARMPTTFVTLIGIRELPFTVVSEAVAANRRYEVVLVVDVTGSMKGSRINALRRSAKTFVETLLPDGKPPLPSEASSKAVAASGRGAAADDRNIRVAIVPYSAAVNIGTHRADWLSPSPGGLQAIAANRYVFSQDEVAKADCRGTNVTWDDAEKLCHIGELSTWTEPGACPGVESGGVCHVANGWAGCVMERAGTAEELTDATPATRAFAPYYWPSYGGPGGGSNRYNSYLPNDVNESWNTNANTNNGRGPNLGCPKNVVVPFTDDRDLLLSEIKDFEAWHRGGTMGHVGLAWGWRMLSPSWRGLWDSSAYPHDYDPQRVEKIVVFMTDGANGFYTGHAPSGDSDYTAYGRLSETDAFDSGNHHTQLNRRMNTVCASMKEHDIEIFTVGFDLSSSSAQDVLGACASSTGHVFTSNTSTLEAHFRQIATDIAERRIALTR
jgi:Flp pilus assembly protein TadG